MSNDIIEIFRKTDYYKFIKRKDTQPIVDEIFRDNYKVFNKGVTFKKGDIVIDIGANQGIWSILMAKAFPDIVIHSYEPIPDTYEVFLKNIEINEAENITPHNYAVSGDNKPVIMRYNPDGNSGGATSFEATVLPAGYKEFVVETLTLDDILAPYDRVRLLKSDCEGAEYDIFYTTTMLNKVDFAVAEIHTNRALLWKYGSMDKLATFINSKTKLLYWESTHMAE